MEYSYVAADLIDNHFSVDENCVIGGTALVDKSVLEKNYPNTVIASADEVEYISWDVHELSEYLEKHSNVRIAMLHTLHWSLIQALRRKSDEGKLSSQDQDTKINEEAMKLTKEEIERRKSRERYELVVHSVLLDSKVSPQERDFVDALRLKYDLDQSFHEECLVSCGWNKSDWEAGHKLS